MKQTARRMGTDNGGELARGWRTLAWQLRANPGRRGTMRPARSRLQTETLEARCMLDGDVVFSEVMFHAVSGQSAEDWLEIYNRSEAAVNLAGYQIDQGVDFTFPDMELGAGEYLVIAADLTTFQSLHPAVSNVVGPWTGSLSNSGEDLRLIDSTGLTVDETFYADSGDYAVRRLVRDDRNSQFFGWEWIAPHDGGGSTLELIHADFTNDFAHNWGPSTTVGGTPGAANSIASVDIAPAISEVGHSPIIPASGDQVQITARIFDDTNNLSTAVVKYRVSTTTPGAFQEVPLWDDGLHDDGAANDGVFTALLPAQAHNTVVEYYIQTSDGTGHMRTYPAPSDDQGGQAANMLYQVDDTERPSDIPLFRVIMTAQERDLFNQYSNPNHRQSDAERHATIVSNYGGDLEFRYNVGVRYRGSESRNTIPTNNRFNLPSDNPLAGNTAINVNTVAPENQIAGAALWNFAGEPATNAWPVRVLHNGVDRTNGGYYAQVEVANSDWADRTFPNDSNGNSYKGRRANEGPPGGQGATLEYFGENPLAYTSYLKDTNSSEADYTDLIRWTDILNNEPDATYVERLSEVMDIDQWFRSMALIELTGFNEYGLLNGDASGDDWATYRGVEDPRFVFLPYDFDTMFNVGINSGFRRAENVPALNRLLNFPGMQPRFYQAFIEIGEKLTAPNVKPHLMQFLGAVLPETQIDGMVGWVQSRVNSVLSRIPQTLTVNSNLTVVGDYPQTNRLFSGTLSGTSNAAQTARVMVNGQQAAWNERAATWSITDVPLHRGINRVVVQSFDASGNEIESTFIDLWSTAAGTNVSGVLSSNTTWSVTNGPYVVSGELTVPAGVTLTIQPGTTVFFQNNASMTIRGRLVAVGEENNEIHITREPSSGGTWGGLQFRDSMQDNRLEHVVLEWGRTNDGMIGLEGSRLTVENATLDNTDRRRIRSIDSSLVVRNSRFENIFEPGQAPTSDNFSEHIWGSGIPEGGEFIIEGNTFGTITGHNDGIDFDAPRLPGPIPHILNNTFLGGGDDALDMTGDVHIEGNVFRNYIKDQFNQDPGQSNVISASSGDYYVLRNTFENVQHASLVKEGAFMHFLNNTVINSSFAALYFDLPGQTSGPGRGAVVEGSIFANTPAAIDLSNSPTESYSLDYSLVPATQVNLGTHNISGDPVVEDIAAGDFTLRAGSPAIGAARNGGDMGSQVPMGANVAGEPAAVTRANSATLTVGGPGITHYRYRLNGGAWSEETAVSEPIALSGLADGTYQVEVIGKTLLGFWQAEDDPTSSLSWTIDSTLSGLRINEVLASNDSALEHAGTFPDAIELYNAGTTAVDLSGMTLTDDPLARDKYTFPAGTMLAGGEYLVLYADDETAPGIHVGFNLKSEGEGVYLYASEASGGALYDSVEFGVQATDYSIGVDREGDWALTIPTFGGENIAAELGSPKTLVINEWLATNEIVFDMDFIELYNPNPSPVALAGLSLTDNAFRDAGRHVIAPLSFISGSGFAVFIADGNEEDGPDHLDFTLSPRSETIGIHDTDLSLIDMVRYAPQVNDVSEGRSPNGDENIIRFVLPTPGQSNRSTTISNVIRFSDITDVWSYNDTGADLGTGWRSPTFDDSAWPSGPGLLYHEDEPLPAVKSTPINLGQITYYFRRSVTIDDPAELQALTITSVIDDGAVFYVNGTEVRRLRMPGGNITSLTTATNGVGEANFEGPFEIPLELLVPGENVIAVEVHQEGPGSSDVVFGLVLDGTLNPNQSNLTNNELLLEHLRITELMYNPVDGSDFEYIEFQNTGVEPIDLAGVRISEGVDFVFPEMTLGAGEFVLVVNDSSSFTTRYGTEGTVAGEFSGNLANGGERIRLQLPLPSEANILDFEFNDSWYPSTDGDGFSLVIVDPLGERTAWTEKSGWRPSNFIGGSPGLDDAGFASEVLVINEVLANSGDAATGDQIEIGNTTEATLLLDGWYLSNDPANLTKFQLPSGTTITPGGYLSYTETSDFGTFFTLNDHGGQIFLSSPDASGANAGFIASVSYGAAEVGVSQGRHTRSDDGVDFVALTSSTFGGANASPVVGTVVINELHYRSVAGSAEFIELHNRSDMPWSLFDAAHPENRWRLTGAVEYEFPAGTVIPAGGYLVITNGNTATFRTTYGVPAGVEILGPYTGTLDDATDDVRLVRPGAPDQGIVPSILADRVNYGSQAPWPAPPAGVDVAINRIAPDLYGNDPASWVNSIVGGTPGRPNIGVDTTPPAAPTGISGSLRSTARLDLTWEAAIDPETPVQRYIVFRDGLQVGETTSTSFSDNTVRLPATYSYTIIAENAQGLRSVASTPFVAQLATLSAVNSRQSTQVEIRFSEPVTRATAENLFVYGIDQGIEVLSAFLAADGRTVTLTTSPLTENVNYTLSIAGIRPEGTALFPPNFSTMFSYRQTVPGFTVRNIYSTTGIASFVFADILLNAGPTHPLNDREVTANTGMINYLDDDGHLTNGRFGNDLGFPGNTPGDDNEHVMRATGTITVPPGQGGSWTFGANMAIPPSGEIATVDLIAQGAEWSYSDEGVDLGTAWRQRNFDDSAWDVGNGQLGYGDGDETTTLDFGGDPNNKIPTYYFRTTFDIADTSTVQSIYGNLLRDDGVAVYVNGFEVFRDNLSANATFNSYASTTINGGAERTFLPFTINPAFLSTGSNTIAVEIHQAEPDSSDISFDLELFADVDAATASQDGARLRINGTQVFRANPGSGPLDRLGVIELTEGTHTIVFDYFEHNGPSEVELFAAPGSFDSLSDTDMWRLVGDTANGGLSVVTLPLPPTPIEWSQVEPTNLLSYEFNRLVGLQGGGAQTRYQATLTAGQLLSASALPSSNAVVSISISGPDGILTANSSASAGSATSIAGVVIPTSGTYTIDVSSDLATDSEFLLSLNGMAEIEQNTAFGNDSLANAESLASGLRDLGNGIRQVAVRGLTDGVEFVQRVEGTLFAPNVITMDFNDLPADLPSAIIRIAATGDLDGGTETLGFDAEGLVTQQLFATGGITGAPNVFEIRIEGETLAQLLSDGNLRLTFQPSDAVDNLGDTALEVSIRSGEFAVDTYQLDLQAGVPHAFTLFPLSGTTAFQLKVLDSSGATLALGLGTGSSSVVRGFTPASTGTYYLQVGGPLRQQYRLVATEGADLETLPNDSLTNPADLPPFGAVIGTVGGSAGSIEPPNDTRVPANFGVVLNDGIGFQWDIQTDGTVSDGTNDAYDGGMRHVGFFASTSGELEQNGREYVTGTANVAQSVQVVRKVYVSPNEGFARYLDIVTNSGSSATNYNLRIDTNLGSDGGTVLVATSSGDNAFTTADNWIITDDNDNGGDPTVTHVIANNGALRPTLTEAPTGSVTYDYNLSLAPGQTKIIMHFAAQNANRADALANANNLELLKGGALIGINATELSQIVNFRIADTADIFNVPLRTGVTFEARTETPTPVVSGFTNSLNPLLELYDEAGNVVASNDNGAGDGRNARLSYVPTEDGNYRLRVTATTGSGQYILRTSGHSLVARPLEVLQTSPSAGIPVVDFPAYYEVHFSDPVDLTSVAATDLTVNGTPASEVVFVDGGTVRFTIPPEVNVGGGTYQVAMEENAIQSLTGGALTAFESSFLLDSAPPTITEIFWNGAAFPEDGILRSGQLTLQIVFSEPIRGNVLSSADYRLRDLNGQFNLSSNGISYQAETNTAFIFFPSVPEGDFELTLRSQDDSFEDLVGNDLDGEASDSNDGLPTGDGQPGGDFVKNFRVADPLGPLDGIFVPIVPAGSMIYGYQNNSEISFEGDIDGGSILLDEGELINVILLPNHPSATYTVAVINQAGTTLATTTSEPGAAAILENLVIPVAGQYTVSVTGDTVDSAYDLRVGRNVGVESGNAGTSGPYDLNSTATSVGPRWAVVGETATTRPSVLLWGVSPALGEILLYDGESGRVVDRFDAPGTLAPEHTNIGLSIAERGRVLLYVNSDDDPNVLYRLDSLTGTLLSTEVVSGGIHDGLGVAGGQIYYSRDGVDLRRQPGLGQAFVDGWGPGVPSAVGGDDAGRIFVFTPADSMLHEVDTVNNQEAFLSDISTTLPDVEGLAFTGTFLAASSSTGQVHLLYPDTGELVASWSSQDGGLFGLAAYTEFTPELVELEPNDELAQAQNIDGGFSLTSNPNIGTSQEDTSTIIPHATIIGTGDGTYDLYRFTVSQNNARVILDLDGTNNLDGYLDLLSSTGGNIQSSDDNGSDPGSTTSLDSLIDTVLDAGTYYVRVGSCCTSPVSSDAAYILHVSVEGHARGSSDAVPISFVNTGSTWKYLDDGSNQGNAWIQPNFDDSAWASGPSQLGYGDGDETTVVGFGPDPNDVHITTYFRHEFDVANPMAVENLVMSLLRDDGAAVYLNGVEVVRDNLRPNAGYNDVAIDFIAGNAENIWLDFAIPSERLVPGRNVLAVEIHQNSGTSSDLSFDMRLSGMLPSEMLAIPEYSETDQYTIDLTDLVGTPTDIVLNGLNQSEYDKARLELIAPDGKTVVATAQPEIMGGEGASNADLAIIGYQVDEPGVYTLRLSDTPTGQYTLLVTNNARFEFDVTTDVDAYIPDITGTSGAMGYMLPPGGASSVVDAQGDTLQVGIQGDIVTASAGVIDGNLEITVTLANAPPAGSEFGIYVDLDLDQNPSTGRDSLQQDNMPPAQQGGDLGVERSIVMFHNSFGNTASLFDSDFNQLGSYTLTTSGATFQVSVPLEDLGDDGNINLSFITYDQSAQAVSDAAPDTEFLTVGPNQSDEVELSVDTYRLTLEAGQSVILETHTPLDGQQAAALNTVNLGLRVESPSGEIYEDLDSASDGHNARLVLDDAEAGEYIIHVVGEEGRGGYQLLVTPNVPTGSTVLGRHLIYNSSLFDRNGAVIDASDAAAVATDKAALLPGQTATFANYSSYSRGINAVAIDIEGMTGQVTTNDFQFLVGNDAVLGNWTNAPAPSQVLTFAGAGNEGSDRIVLVWDDNAIEQQWLQVTLLANENTGLTSSDVFYFGSAIGETGDHTDNATVDADDELGARNNPRTFVNPAAIDDPYDFNRDGRVDAADQIIARNHSTAAGGALILLTAPGESETSPVPSPELTGDFSLNGVLDIQDLDLLSQAVVAKSSDTVFDLDENGLIDRGDLQTWIVSLYRSLPGDINLDYQVDATDFAVWQQHAFTHTGRWSQGDVNGDGVTDVSDLNQWYVHRFQTTLYAASASTGRTPRATTIDAPAPVAGVYMLEGNAVRSLQTRSQLDLGLQLFLNESDEPKKDKHTSFTSSSTHPLTELDAVRQQRQALALGGAHAKLNSQLQAASQELDSSLSAVDAFFGTH